MALVLGVLAWVQVEPGAAAFVLEVLAWVLVEPGAVALGQEAGGPKGLQGAGALLQLEVQQKVPAGGECSKPAESPSSVQ